MSSSFIELLFCLSFIKIAIEIKSISIECCNFIGKPLLKRYTDGICSRQIDRKVEIIVRSWKSNKKREMWNNFLWNIFAGSNLSAFYKTNSKLLERMRIDYRTSIAIISGFKSLYILFVNFYVQNREAFGFSHEAEGFRKKEIFCLQVQLKFRKLLYSDI